MPSTYRGKTNIIFLKHLVMILLSSLSVFLSYEIFAFIIIIKKLHILFITKLLNKVGNEMQQIIYILPEHIKEGIIHLIEHKRTSLEEIRLRLQQPVELIFQHENIWMEDYIFNEQDSRYLLSQLTEHSLYRMEHELQEGYITIRGGHRVGLSGKVIVKSEHHIQLQQITYYNIRVAKEIIDVARPFIPYLLDNQRYQNTLLIGPPNTGKTTMIRDLARLMSDGNDWMKRKKVAIVDERSEIAAAIDGVPQHNVGKSTDVMDACPKAVGMMMMIRSMSPDVIIVDEIGRDEDVRAINEAILSGVTIICTIHGDSYTEVKNRPSMKKLFEADIFTRIITLPEIAYDQRNGNILDSKGKELITNRIEKC